MYRIIDGKRYNTETAECVASYSHGYPRDFEHFSEDLYRKRNGEFFLLGEGGPMSKYRSYDGNNEWSGGTKLIPLTYEKAQKWAEENLTGDEYESIFGEIEEDEEEGRRTVNFSLAPSVCEKLKRAAAKAGMTKSELIAKLISDVDTSD